MYEMRYLRVMLRDWDETINVKEALSLSEIGGGDDDSIFHSVFFSLIYISLSIVDWEER